MPNIQTYVPLCFAKPRRYERADGDGYYDNEQSSEYCGKQNQYLYERRVLHDTFVSATINPTNSKLQQRIKRQTIMIIIIINVKKTKVYIQVDGDTNYLKNNKNHKKGDITFAPH